MSAGDSILLIGGYGAVGSAAARTLRRLYPELGLIIAGRDQNKASALASELGKAEGVTCDLAKPGLGLTPLIQYRAMVVLAKDDHFYALDEAVAKNAMYTAISDYAVEIAPLVARSGGQAKKIPVLLLGHHLAGLVTLATIHHTKDLQAVSAVRIGAIFETDDFGGATAQADATRVAHATPYPLMLVGGRWTWANAPESTREFVDAEGGFHTGKALSLLDVASLAAATRAESVRFDVAVRGADDLKIEQHTVMVEIDGVLKNGRSMQRRISIFATDFHTKISGRALAFVLGQTMGLDPQPKLSPGFWLPENALDAGQVLNHATDFGITVHIQDVLGEAEIGSFRDV